MRCACVYAYIQPMIIVCYSFFTDTSAEGSLNVAAVIAGSCLALLVILCIIAGLIYRAHLRNQWRRFRDEHIDTDDVFIPDPSYPVTYKYLRGIRGHPGVQTFHDEPGESKTDKWRNNGVEM